jgi:hypothetical protein
LRSASASFRLPLSSVSLIRRFSYLSFPRKGERLGNALPHLDFFSCG